MSEYTTFKKPLQVKLADNTVLFAYGKGNVHVLVYDGEEKLNVTLKDVFYVPKIQHKLLSLPSITEKGVEVQFKGQSCKILINDKVYSIGHKHGKLYKLNSEPDHSCCFGSTGAIDDNVLWHHRYGHLGYDNLKLLCSKSMVNGMTLNTQEQIVRECEGCAVGKQNRQPFPKKSTHHSTEPLELIHSDVCGPMNIASVGGSRYFVTFIDDYSRYTAVYMMKNKSEVFQKFKEFVALSENSTGKRVKRLRSDNGGEYASEEFLKYCKMHGILKEDTIPYTPQQNGTAERMNRTIMETVRSILHHAGLPTCFWAEAVSTAVYIRNRSPTTCLKEKTPYESWHNEKPNVSNLKVFGCNALVHIPDQKRSKLDKKSMLCTFVGYPSGSNGYKLYNPETKKMIRSRDVIFMESSFGNRLLEKERGPEELTTNEETNIESGIVHFKNANADDDGDNAEEHGVAEEQPGRPQRNRVAPERYGSITGEWWNYATLAAADVDEPRHMNEALKGKNAQQWKDATDNEYNSLMKNDTWELVDLPEGRNLVGCKWLFKVKRKEDGSVSRYKARLVAQGYSQEAGEDYDEVFAPVAKYNSIRSVLAIANQLDLEVHQMDVKTAFLNGNLNNEIYMQQPQGYEDKNQPHKVCKLRKSLYGLKQSARCWNMTLDRYLKESGYVQSTADPCIYCKSENKSGKNSLIMIAVYVDDAIMASNDMAMLTSEKLNLSKMFEMEDLGEIHYCLGMSVKRDRKAKVLMINQKTYLENVLKKFGMQDCKPISTPMEVTARYEKLADDEKTVNIKEYQAMIGSLTYASISTRPDLSAAVGALSQFMTKPGQQHLKGIKRVLRYVKGTLDYGLRFDCSSNEEFNLYGYSDSDWAGDVSTRISTSGYIFRLGGATISWKSKRQATVALSSTEAEYIALCAASQEVVWLRRLLASMGLQQKEPTTLNEDNQGTIALSKNPKSHARTKHIDIKYHYVREVVEREEIELVYCSTDKMIADILTKGLPKPKFEELRSLMGVKSFI